MGRPAWVVQTGDRVDRAGCSFGKTTCGDRHKSSICDGWIAAWRRLDAFRDPLIQGDVQGEADVPHG